MSDNSVGPKPKSLKLDTPVQFVKGVGPRRAERLAGEGILTVSDLLNHAPFRYEDRTNFRPFSSLREGEWTVARGRVRSIGRIYGRGKVSIFEMLVADETGSIPLKFFNQPYLRNVYKENTDIIIYGQARRDNYAGGALGFVNPECEILREGTGPSVHSGRVVPVYRKLAGLRTRQLRQITASALSGLVPDAREALPTELRNKLCLPSRYDALMGIHFPEVPAESRDDRIKALDKLNAGDSPAHKRLVFEELFHFQVGIRLVRERRSHERKDRKLQLDDNVRQAIRRILPFHPTRAQKRVLREIAEDMISPRPMSRLLQGDVGSGKTIVAAQAAIIAVENGFQVAVMAPTEVLAEQHYFNLRRLLSPLAYGVDLLKGGLGAKQRRAALERIRRGETSLAIGTHALIQEGVEFRDLALVVIDEQHRFGVIQRNLLREKGALADVLVMTATPIPRSLALTLYGDLDVSVIDELPPGRRPVQTFLYEEKDRAKAYREMHHAVTENHQVYVVYPLVEESEKSDLRAASEMAEHLSAKVFPGFTIGLLHGKMKSSEKDRVMSGFAQGEISILVATTVIEVGVDVANATVMVVEHAERFGLAQLHQLRGRVGRSAAQSKCILIGAVRGNPEGRRRLETMCSTNDGFRIAEVDLELRGPGEIVGTRQSGIPLFEHADLVRDRRALVLAREEADRFVRNLRSRPDEESRRIAAYVQQRLQDRYGAALVG